MIFFYLLIIAYSFYVLELIFGFNQRKNSVINSVEAYTNFSIIIPFHNEFEHLLQLIHSLNTIEYPKGCYEVIFIDDTFDHSLVIKNAQFDYQVISNQRKSGSPKKDALELGIHFSKNNWIVTTDADCLFPKDWLKTFHANVNQSRMLVGSVLYQKETGFLKDFQYYDFLSLQGVTASSFHLNKPFMCNGANLAFQKSLFYEIGGYEDNNHIASGDDVFLLQKVLNYDRNCVKYLGNQNSVVTFSVDSWQKLFNQRARWGKKTSAYKNNYPKILGFITISTNLIFYPLLIWSLFNYHLEGLLIVALKVFLDEIFLLKSASFFQLEKRFTLHFTFFYPIFMMLVLLKMIIGNNKWK